MKTQSQELARFWTDPYANPAPDGETLVAFEKRVLSAWEAIRQVKSGRRILVITHGGVIRMLLCHSRKLPRNDLLQIEVPYASLHSVLVPTRITEPASKYRHDSQQ